MPDDTFDKRLREVENKVYSFEQSFGRIADDIHDIKLNIQEFIEVKSKLNAIDVLFKRIAELRRDISTLDKSMTPISVEHASCMKKRETMEGQVNDHESRLKALENEMKNTVKLKDGAINFLSGRAGSLFDWVLKIALAAMLFYAARKV